MARTPRLAPFDYVLREERALPISEQTIFHLRPLEHAERVDIYQTEATQEDDGSITVKGNPLRRAAKILFYGLLGWDNLRDQDDKPVAFRKGKAAIPDELLTLIQAWEIELANAITEGSELSKESSKNSTSP
jgi:hypothetical protein